MWVFYTNPYRCPYTPLQRSVTAWVGWQARERDPLRTGQVAGAFGRYLALRYPPAAPGGAEALRALAGRLRAEGRLRLAEAADDAVLDRLATDRVDRDGRTGLVASLWNDGPRLYAATQTAWAWQGMGGPPPRPLGLPLDAAYAAAAARRLTAFVLGGQSVRLAFGSPDADRARLWLDRLSESLGLTLRAVAPDAGAKGADAHPAGPLVFAEACGPLLGDAAEGDTAGRGPCLLRTDQLELLARSCLAREGLEAREADRLQARRLLQYLQRRDPKYPRAPEVRALLAGLGGPPPGPAAVF